MEETPVDPIEETVGDFAFAVLDWLLYHAVFHRGQITVRHKREQFSCYTVRELRHRLTQITEAAVMKKHNRLPADMDAIVNNAMNEWGRDIHSCFGAHRKSA